MSALQGMLEFVAVVESGTFTNASRRLRVSVSHISRQVAELEHRLAAQLFIRSTRKMQLTEPGRRLFHASQPLLQELLRAQETVLAGQDALEGSVRISLAGRFAEDKLVPLLARFCLAHPGIELSIDMTPRNVDMAAEGVDLALRLGPLQSSSSIIATRLLAVPMRLLASPALLAKLPPMNAPSKLPPALCLPLGSRPWEFTKGRRREAVKPTGRFTSNSGAAMAHAAAAGLGIVNLPAYYAVDFVADKVLVPLMADWVSVDETVFHLAFPAGRHMPARVRRLIDYLQANVESLL